MTDSDDAPTQRDGDGGLEATETGVDAANESIDTPDAAPDTQPDTQPDTEQDTGQIGDVHNVEGSLADAAPVVCEMLADGSCSPAPDYALPPCNGCYGYTGQRYDLTAKCLHPPTDETLVCTRACLGGTAVQCYVRETDGSMEVILLEIQVWDDGFEQETGLAECDSALNQEVATAPLCD